MENNDKNKITAIIVIGVISVLTCFTIVTPIIGLALIYSLVTGRDIE